MERTRLIEERIEFRRSGAKRYEHGLVRVWAPERRKGKAMSWECHFEVEGVTEGTVRGFGQGPVTALISAMGNLRYVLDCLDGYSGGFDDVLASRRRKRAARRRKSRQAGKR